MGKLDQDCLLDGFEAKDLSSGNIENTVKIVVKLMRRINFTHVCN